MRFLDLFEETQIIRTSNLNTLKVLVNPTVEEFQDFLEFYSTGVRGFTDGKTYWFWDAYEEIHPHVADALGLDSKNLISFYITNKKNNKHIVGAMKGPDEFNYLKNDPKFQKYLKGLKWVPSLHSEGDAIYETIINEWDIHRIKGWVKGKILSPETEEKIRNYIKQGTTVTELANMFGLNQREMQSILKSIDVENL